jgi:protoporphyrinogen oxidase
VTAPGRILILGAGPTGLGAAYRLQELGVPDVLVLEAADHPGGLASSHRDDAGFTWDMGGHVQFSHYRYYDAVLDRALGGEWLEHDREAWVWIHGRFVPYPFQYNLHRLDRPHAEAALAGLEAVAGRTPAAASDFRQWIAATFGPWIAEHFLYPYNAKVWGYPLEELGVSWMGERVAVPDVERVRRNLREGRDDVSWGPNSRFRFPKVGGTGAIWRAVAGLLPAGRVRLRSVVTEVDLEDRRVTTASGETFAFDVLISALPLDRLCAMTRGLDPEVRAQAAELVHSSCHIVGVGLEGGQPPALSRKCWMYFPEAGSPYYRVTVFSNYSPDNVPDVPGCWSLMAEVCETAHRPVDAATLPGHVVAAMRRDGLVAGDARVASLWHRRLEHGYPTPSRGRDRILERVLPALEARSVFSRGRFGAWKYEVSNQDHSFMQGVEVANRLLGVDREYTLPDPGYVNGGAFLAR